MYSACANHQYSRIPRTGVTPAGRSMQGALRFHDRDAMTRQVISPLAELGAYESLWLQDGASFKRLAEKFAAAPGWLPSDFVDSATAQTTGRQALEAFRQHGVDRFGVRVHRAGEYPPKLREARHPVELLYFAGLWELAESPMVSVVGTRNPSPEGLKRANKVARMLVRAGWTVASGLAAGIDRAAHEGALEEGGRTVAVLGTPLAASYPRENADLQRRLAREQLVVSQVPLLRYLQQPNPRANRHFFPERNVTMSALTQATVIIEAGETSGTRTQARATLEQGNGRKLFILDSCFKRDDLKWPRDFEARGAIRVSDFAQITDALGSPEAHRG